MPTIQKDETTGAKALPSHAKVVVIGGGVWVFHFIPLGKIRLEGCDPARTG